MLAYEYLIPFLLFLSIWAQRALAETMGKEYVLMGPLNLEAALLTFKKWLAHQATAKLSGHMCVFAKK